MGCYIYALEDPRNGHIRYVGQSKTPEERLRQHLSKCRLERNAPARWLRELQDLGLCPHIVILDKDDEKVTPFLEQFYIKAFEQAGFRLLNVSRVTYCPETAAAIVRAAVCHRDTDWGLGRS